LQKDDETMDDAQRKAQNYVTYEVAKAKFLNTILSKGLISQDEYDRADRYLYEHYHISEIPNVPMPMVDPKQLHEIKEIIRPDSQFVSLTELARQYSEESPGYVIQSWMRDMSTIEFLHLWEKANNSLFQEKEYIALLDTLKSSNFTLTPKQWITRTNAIGIQSKQGKSGGTFAHTDIACEFKSWLSPKFKMEMVQKYRSGI